MEKRGFALKKLGLGYLFVTLGLIAATILTGILVNVVEGILYNIMAVLTGTFLTILVVGSPVYWVVVLIRWNKRNKDTPIRTKQAEVVVKRKHVSTDSEGDTTTSYYATFETQDGKRMEFRIKGGQYGLLREGDQGELRYQIYRNSRKKYHGFTRT